MGATLARVSGGLVAVAAVVLATPRAEPKTPSAVAQENGAALYREHCARCHGDDGRGNGPLAGQFQFRPADLTGLSRRAGGRFPARDVTRIVDGRKPLRGHGGPEMPVWGDVLKSPGDSYGDESVREVVRQIVGYLETIQEPRPR